MGNTCVYGDPVHEKLLEQVRDLQAQVRTLEEEVQFWKQRATLSGAIDSPNNSPPPAQATQSAAQQVHYSLPPTGPPPLAQAEPNRPSGLVKVETPPYAYSQYAESNSAGPSSQASTPQIAHHPQLSQHLGFELAHSSHPGSPHPHPPAPPRPMHPHAQLDPQLAQRQASLPDLYNLHPHSHPHSHGYYQLGPDGAQNLPPPQGLYTHSPHYHPNQPHVPDPSRAPPQEIISQLTQQEAEALYGEDYASQFRPRSA